jgi:hypothetical protein
MSDGPRPDVHETPEVPIACSLDAVSLHERLDAWRALVASSVMTIERDQRQVRLVLASSDAALLEAASLGRLEKQCCPFFDVSIELGPDERALVLRVPAGTDDVLGAFVDEISAR